MQSLAIRRVDRLMLRNAIGELSAMAPGVAPRTIYAALQRDTLELPAVDVELLERIKGTLCERDAVGRRVVSALPV